MRDKRDVENRGQPTRALIVDGDPVSALILEKFFLDQGIRTEHVSDGQKALDACRRHPYSLVIADRLLPRMDGIELCRQMRALETGYIYFILCGAECDLEEAYEAGIDDFVDKPLEYSRLMQRLTVARRILGHQSQLREQSVEVRRKSDTLQAMNNSLMHASRRFEELFNGLPMACFTLDAQGLIHEWNRHAEKHFGIPAHLAFQKPVWELLGQKSSGFWGPGLVTEVFEGRTVEDLDWRLQAGDSERFFVCNLFGLRDLRGNLIGAISANLDITERKEAERRIDEQMVTINQYAKQLQRQKAELLKTNQCLSQLALTDAMTGLFNHRGFQEELHRAFERCNRMSVPLSLILIDVDHFKNFNDTFGHQAGDNLLQQFGQILQTTTRRHEPAARYGGEEFAIILDGSDQENAHQAALRFQKAIHRSSWTHRAITASFGVATVTGPDCSREELIRRADMALYASKNRGRDCVTHFNEIDHIHIAA